ncbi:MAG TPA: hypothetical protein VNK41_06585 [Vicinamibacterales bacterium]|nr:hypothetical protein [Vicinamibacterales bacterium]
MTPLISAIVVAPFGFGHVRQLVRVLSLQTIRDRMEVVVVTPSASEIGAEDRAALAAFGAHKMVELTPMTTLTRARAVGIESASAPVAVLTEDHCFPEPGWAEALVRAHQGPWAAVGPVFEQPIQTELFARAACLLQYAPWTRPAKTGEVTDLPGHNSSYKRDVLLKEYGARLADLLAGNTALHWDLRRRGYRLWLEPDARVHHVFMSQPGASLSESFYIGWGFAATRALGWSLPRRALFAAASPAIPAVRLARIIPRAFELGWGSRLPAVLGPTVLQLVASAVGELLGVTLGPGTAVAMGVELDTRRYRFVTPEVKALFWSEDGRPTRFETLIAAGDRPAAATARQS